MNRAELQFLLKKYGITPRRQQGQNFLLNDRAIAAAVEAADLTDTDTVLEIGPGLGVLTTALAERAGRVIAVEQDRDLVQVLQPIAKQFPNLTVANADIRTFHLAAAGLHDRQYKLVSNLPYNLTSWVLRHFLESTPRPSTMVVMVQREVADRVLAKPGAMSVLAVATQCLAEPTLVRKVSAGSFYPVPEVDSALLKLTLRPEPRTADLAEFLRLVKIGFAARRKQLHNNLQAGFQLTNAEARALLDDIGLPASSRPQELGVDDWEALRKAIFSRRSV
jgi:16S rRNA (adenine1518-N6/adenine1519-N6)-dimethyltransferase